MFSQKHKKGLGGEWPEGNQSNVMIDTEPYLAVATSEADAALFEALQESKGCNIEMQHATTASRCRTFSKTTHGPLCK